MARLGHGGSSTALRRELFPRGFAGEVMRIILDTWGTFSVPVSVSHENSITALFREALIRAYVAAGRSWFITLEDPIINSDSGTQEGRNDLRFYPPNHAGQAIFFAVECKRLRVTTASGFEHLADKYASEGIRRFVDGPYCKGLPCGGIVGYVMDSQMDDALASVLREIRRPGMGLCFPGQGGIRTPSAILQGHKWGIDTRHLRPGGQAITLHHVLLGVRDQKML